MEARTALPVPEARTTTRAPRQLQAAEETEAELDTITIGPLPLPPRPRTTTGGPSVVARSLQQGSATTTAAAATATARQLRALRRRCPQRPSLAGVRVLAKGPNDMRPRPP
ncbi:hypothetical protein MRX96_041037 [Rhipicephalus microplus]